MPLRYLFPHMTSSSVSMAVLCQRSGLNDYNLPFDFRSFLTHLPIFFKSSFLKFSIRTLVFGIPQGSCSYIKVTVSLVSSTAGDSNKQLERVLL